MGLFKKNKPKIENVATKTKKDRSKSSGKSVGESRITEDIFTEGGLPKTGISTGFLGQLPNPSKLLQKIMSNPGNTSAAEVIQDILDDEHVSAVVELLQSGIMRHYEKWKIFSKSKSEEKRLTKVFKNIKLKRFIETIITGRLKGMAVFEIKWNYSPEKGYSIRDILPLPAKDFTFDEDNNLMYKKTQKVYDKKYKYKFLVYKNKGYENPYGVPGILKCYYPWLFKKGGWKFWMITTEKYSVPTLVVDFDSSQVDDVNAKADELADRFRDIESDTVVVTNGLGENSAGIKTIEVKAKANEFKTLINKTEESISKSIIGTHIIMDGGSGGSRALAEIGANINFRFKVQTAIVDICDTINELLKLDAYLQTGEEDNPNENKFIIPYINIQEWEKIREAITLGIPVSMKAIYMHIPEPENDEDVFLSQKFLEQEPYDIDNDRKNITQETKEDTATGRTKKDGKTKEETRDETSQEGMENPAKGN